MGVGGVWMVLFYDRQEPVGRLLLADQSDGGDNGGMEPGVAGLGERGAQELESFGRVNLGYSHRGFGSSIVLG